MAMYSNSELKYGSSSEKLKGATSGESVKMLALFTEMPNMDEEEHSSLFGRHHISLVAQSLESEHLHYRCTRFQAHRQCCLKV